MRYWLVTRSGKLISKKYVKHVTREEYLKTNENDKIEIFIQELDGRFHNDNLRMEGGKEFQEMYLEDIFELVEYDGISG